MKKLSLVSFLKEDHNNALEDAAKEALGVCGVHSAEGVEYIDDGHYEQALQNVNTILQNANIAKQNLEKHINAIKSGKEQVGPKGGGEELV